MSVTSLARVHPTVGSTLEQRAFPSPDFQAEALIVEPFDAIHPAVRGLQYPINVRLRDAYVERGLVGPFEILHVNPLGEHTRAIIDVIPITLIAFPQEAGIHQITLREVAHMRWWGALSYEVIGDS